MALLTRFAGDVMRVVGPTAPYRQPLINLFPMYAHAEQVDEVCDVPLVRERDPAGTVQRQSDQIQCASFRIRCCVQRSAQNE